MIGQDARAIPPHGRPAFAALRVFLATPAALAYRPPHPLCVGLMKEPPNGARHR
jgi:hypothetical protein